MSEQPLDTQVEPAPLPLGMSQAPALLFGFAIWARSESPVAGAGMNEDPSPHVTFWPVGMLPRGPDGLTLPPSQGPLVGHPAPCKVGGINTEDQEGCSNSPNDHSLPLLGSRGVPGTGS